MATDTNNHVEDPGKVDLQLGHLGNETEHKVGMLEAIRKYPQACGWCVYSAVCCLMVSFEGQASGSILGIPEFRKDFGYEVSEGSYTLSASWQSAFGGAPVAS